MLKFFRRADQSAKAPKTKKKEQKGKDDSDIGEIQSPTVINRYEPGEFLTRERKDAETKDSSETIRPTKAGVRTNPSTDEISGSTQSTDLKKHHKKRHMKRHVGDSMENVKPACKAAHKKWSNSPSVKFTSVNGEVVKLRRTVTDDRSAPKLEHATPTSVTSPLFPQATIGEGKKRTVDPNPARNQGIVDTSSINTCTRSDLTGLDKVRVPSPDPLLIGGEYQPNHAKDAHKLPPKIPSGHKQRLFHKRSTINDQVDSPEKTLDDTPNEVTAQDTFTNCGATASKEHSSAARNFFNSLRSKKSMAKISKITNITTMPNTPDLFFSPPLKDLPRNESNANFKDTFMGMVPSPFDSSPVSVNPVSPLADSVFRRNAPISYAINPAYGLSTTNHARKPPQSLGTAYTSSEGSQRPNKNGAGGEADSSPPNGDANYDDDSSEEDYMSPEVAMGSSPMLPPNPEEEEKPEFADDSNAVRQLTNAHLQNVFQIGSTRELLSPKDQAALGLGSPTGSDPDTDPETGDVDLTRVKTTSCTSACSTDATRKMLDMSTAIEDLHAAAEGACVNSTGHCDRSFVIASEEQKKNYSTGMEELACLRGGPETAALLEQLSKTNYITYMEELIRTGSNIEANEFEEMAHLRQVNYVGYIVGLSDTHG